MPRSPRHSRPLLALVACLFAVYGCGSASDGAGDADTDDASETSTTTSDDGSAADGNDGSTPQGLESGDGFTVLGALSEFPEPFHREGWQIVVTDLAAAREAAGFEASSDGQTEEEVIEWLRSIAGPGSPVVYVSFSTAMAVNVQNIPEQRTQVGFAALDAEAFASSSQTVGDDSSETLVLVGNFDETTLNTDLHEVAPGIVSQSQADDGLGDGPSGGAFDFSGPTRFAFRDGKIALSDSTAGVESWLAGGETTLADNDDYAAVAGALDERGVVSVLLTDYPDRAELPEPEPGQLTVGPTTMVGVGWGVGDSPGPEITIVYLYVDEDTAASAVAMVEQAFAEGTEFDGAPATDHYELTEATADGRLIVASVTLAPAGRASALDQAVYADIFTPGP